VTRGLSLAGPWSGAAGRELTVAESVKLNETSS
jgi:hypothetical protein